MSNAKIFSAAKNSDAVFERMPEPTPISRNFKSEFFFVSFGNSFLRKSAKSSESSEGWYISI